MATQPVGPVRLQPIPGFCAGSYPSRFRGVSAARTVNLRIEQNEDPNSKSPFTMYPRSGKKPFSIIVGQRIAGAWSNKYRTFWAAGTALYEVFQDGTMTELGTIEIGSNPVTMRANGEQLLICSAGIVYIYTGFALYQPIINYAVGTATVAGATVTWESGLSQFQNPGGSGNVQPGDLFFLPPDGNGNGSTTPFTVASIESATQLTLTQPAGNLSNYAFQLGTELLTGVMCEFIDGYFIVNVPNTKIFRISALEDGTSWNELDYGEKSGSVDNIAAIISNNGYLGLVGDTNSTEIWGDSGNANFPFQRVSGITLSVGTAAPWSVQKFTDGSAVWLVESQGGECQIVNSAGGPPTRISNRAVENAIRSYGLVSDAIGSTYLENGHEYYRIDFPTANRTWELDRSIGVWTEQGTTTPADEVFGAEWGRYRVHVNWPNGQPMDLVGDFRSGSGRIWQVSPDFIDDDGTDIPLLRIAPHMNTNLQWMNSPHFALDCELGTVDPSLVGLDGKPLIPTVSMSYSDDGARTWSQPTAASLGRAGEYEGTFFGPGEAFDATPGSQTHPQMWEPRPFWAGLGGFWISRTYKITSTARELRAVYAGLSDVSN